MAGCLARPTAHPTASRWPPTGLSFAPATAEQVEHRLDAYAEAWREHAAAACVEAEVEGGVDAATHERVQWCLYERRLELTSVIEQLRTPDLSIAQRAVPLVVTLRDVSPCRDATLLASQPAPPMGADRDAVVTLRSELATVSALLWAGRIEAALASAKDVAARAEALAWPPLVAVAKHTEASALVEAGRYAEAEAAALEAYRRAGSVGAWGTAASAAELLITVIGYHQARPAEARTWALNAEIAAALAGDPLQHREAARSSSLGAVEHTAGERHRARALFEHTHALYERAYGPEHIHVATSLNNLANVDYEDGDIRSAIELSRQALAIRERVLGPDHPDVASSLANLSAFVFLSGDAPQALVLQERALAIRRAAFGPMHPHVGGSLGNLGAIHHQLRNDAEAQRALEDAIAVHEATLGPDDIQLATPLIALGQIELEVRDPARAASLLERALAIQQKVLGPEHIDVASALHQLGRARALLGQPAQARTLFEQALAIEERVLPEDHVTRAETLYELGRTLVVLGDTAAGMSRFERAIQIVDANPDVPTLARYARFSLAQALVATGRDHARALALAETASAAFASTGDVELQAEIDAWIGAQRSSEAGPEDRPSREPRVTVPR